MKKLRGILLAVLMIVLSIELVSARESTDESGNSIRPDVPTFGMRGRYAVGYQRFELDDGDIARTASIWYPAIKSDDTDLAITYDVGVGDIMPPSFSIIDGYAYQDAAPYVEKGPYPLIVFSHTYAGPYFVSAYQFEHLASYGFVVYAFDHSYDSFRAFASQNSPATHESFVRRGTGSMVMRLFDVTDAINYIDIINRDDGPMRGLVDMENIGVYGVSYGGYTAVMEAGARLDFSHIDDLCSESYLGSDPVCLEFNYDLETLETQLAELANIDVPPEELWPDFSDSRVDAVAAIAPGRTSLISEAGLAIVNKPIMIQVGTADGTIDDAHRIWDAVSSSTKAFVAFENAGHVFAIGCTEGMWEFFDVCYDPVWDERRAHDLSNHFLTAFFLSQLKDHRVASLALEVESVDFVGIDYQTTIGN